MPERLEQIKAREQAATPGPWHTDVGGFSSAPDFEQTFSVAGPPSDFMYLREPADADFIAHAREDVPVLLAEVERLTAERDKARREAMEQSAGVCDDEAQRYEDLAEGSRSDNESAVYMVRSNTMDRAAKAIRALLPKEDAP